MELSATSLKRRVSSSEEKENVRIDKSRNDVDKQTKQVIDNQQDIRSCVVEEFRKRNLKVPFEMIGDTNKPKIFRLCCTDMIDHKPTSDRNRNHCEHRKELYGRLCHYLDARRIRDHGQTYIYPELINCLIRTRFPEDLRDYQTVKKMKHGQLVDVTEINKYYVQWDDFCKET